MGTGEMPMDALENIFTRHSVPKVKPDPVPREDIEKLLAAAVQAPNHYRVRPWRFFVLTGQARNRLGDVMASSLKKHQPGSLDSEIEHERSRPLRAPVLVIVAVDTPVEPKTIEIENICAGAAAVENLLLAAHALGLGAMWRTGHTAYNPDVKDFLGLHPNQHIIAIVYIGYPEPLPVTLARPSFEDRTIWME